MEQVLAKAVGSYLSEYVRAGGRAYFFLSVLLVQTFAGFSVAVLPFFTSPNACSTQEKMYGSLELRGFLTFQ